MVDTDSDSDGEHRKKEHRKSGSVSGFGIECISFFTVTGDACILITVNYFRTGHEPSNQLVTCHSIGGAVLVIEKSSAEI